jgi:hypothetical protein
MFNVLDFEFGHLSLIGNLKLGFGIFYLGKSKDPGSKKGDF